MAALRGVDEAHEVNLTLFLHLNFHIQSSGTHVFANAKVWIEEGLIYEPTYSQSSVDAIAKQKDCWIIEILRLLGLRGKQDKTARSSELVENLATGTARK